MRSQTNIGVTPPLVVATIGRDPVSVAPTCAPACGSRLRRLARGLYAVGFRTTHHRFEINGEECHRLQLVELSAVSRVGELGSLVD